MWIFFEFSIFIFEVNEYQYQGGTDGCSGQLCDSRSITVINDDWIILNDSRMTKNAMR